jgi:hypothetical protein
MDTDREPALRDLLVDPLLHAMMARDGVDYRALLDVIDGARARLGLPAIGDEATLACLFETTSRGGASGYADHR